MTESGEELEERCTSCGAVVTGAYCSACGERRLRADEYSLGRLLRDGFHDFFSVDAAFWRSFRLLFTRPGQLTRDWMAGNRGGRLGPFQLFIAANVIYFFVQPYSGFTGYNTTLFSHMDRQYYSIPAGIRERVVDDVVGRIDERVRVEAESRAVEGTPPWTVDDSVAFRERASAIENEVYPTRFDARGEVNARSLVILTVPMVALVVAGLHVLSGAPFVQHVVFSIHYMAWTLTFLMSLVLPLLIGGITLVRSTIVATFGAAGEAFLLRPAVQNSLSLLTENGSLLIVVPYLYLALRRVYGRGRAVTWGTAVLLALGTFVVTMAYRFILFWVTFASM